MTEEQFLESKGQTETDTLYTHNDLKYLLREYAELKVKENKENTCTDN